MEGTGRSTGSYRLGYWLLAAIGLFALLLLASAGIGTRLGIWHFRTGFNVLKYAAFCGMAVSVLALLSAAYAYRKRAFRGVYLSLFALCCGMVAFAFPASFKAKANRYPRIHDITTDVNTPPEFSAVIPKRGGAVPYGGASIALLQLEAYPDLRTRVLPVPTERVFQAALDTAQEMGWDIISALPAQGRIEATDTTFWFGFKDDIVIRITSAGNRSLLDVRSVSRVGISDVGTNAKRIRQFLKKISNKIPTLQTP